MSVKKEDNKTYTVQFRYIDILSGQSKTYKKRGFPSQTEAKKHEARKRLELSENTGQEYTWDELCDLYLTSRKGKTKDRTISNYQNLYDTQLYGIFGKAKARNINAQMIEAWQKKLLSNGFKNAYLEKIQQTASSIMNFAVVRTIMPINVLRVVGFVRNVDEPKKEMAFWTYPQYQAFQSMITDEEAKLIFEVLYFTGLRIGEFQALTWNDLKEDGSLFIHSNYNNKAKLVSQTTKTYENRYVDLPSKLAQKLRKRKKEMSKYSDFSNDKYIFGYHEPFPRKTIENWKNKYIAAYNESKSGHDKIPQIRIHDIRHSHVSLLINDGVDRFVIAKRLGHSIEMVEKVYGHLFPENRKSVVGVLDKY